MVKAFMMLVKINALCTSTIVAMTFSSVSTSASSTIDSGRGLPIALYSFVDPRWTDSDDLKGKMRVNERSQATEGWVLDQIGGCFDRPERSKTFESFEHLGLRMVIDGLRTGRYSACGGVGS